MTTINLVPNWEHAMPIIIYILENATEEGKQVARDELMRLARAVDKANSKLDREEDRQ